MIYWPPLAWLLALDVQGWPRPRNIGLMEIIIFIGFIDHSTTRCRHGNCTKASIAEVEATAKGEAHGKG